MTTVERIDTLFKKKKVQGISARSILIELGISETALSEWNRGKSKPTVQTLMDLADYFGVSVDYLLGRETPAESELTLVPDGLEISKEDKKLLDAYHDLRPELRQLLWNMIESWQISSAAGTQKKKA